MWKFKPFAGKEPTGLEGRVMDIGNVKIQIQNAIAEGGFSCVYLARDAVSLSKQYALKHMICQDGESLELAMKEISVMKLLKGHPNVVTLVAHTILDMGRRKEALLVMEFCEKSLVTVLENRGAGYFEEKQVLLIFRDVCNAVFAMHCQSPPIAHRDLKAENVLLGSNGAWKLCDFGSTSTNHKCFDKPEEMGIEEDNIRKHTTPAYRAPEMWDLYRRDIISEKVDIWALGCLLYRICYFKLAFDGESKLQVLNGNFRIPEVPKYSASITSLIKDMLESSPDTRPDITQVWFRVNEALPVELQKDLPDGSSSAFDKHSPSPNRHDEGIQKRTPSMPRRSPPPPPSSREQSHNKVSTSEGSMGAFWSTQHAQNSQIDDKDPPLFDDEAIGNATSKNSQANPERRKSMHGNTLKGFNNGANDDYEISFSPEKKPLDTEIKPTFQNEAFNTFVADFNSANSTNKNRKSGKADELEAEVVRLREQLKQTNLEKAEITGKYEKLTAICRSQRQELQELKRALAASTPSPSSKGSPTTPEIPQREKIEGTVWELQQGIIESSPPNPDPKSWQPFAEEPKQQAITPKSLNPRSVRTINGHRNTMKQQSPTSSTDEWGFGQESFKAAPSAEMPRSSVQGSTSQRFGASEVKKAETGQPAGWAGF
ncbi:uncharacterized protein A4U43_C05F30890 [Asparagus officinalis]|uniref:non-specific serine/threonine protein kinase n=1 Tax=Asparagus officinalis TaxID=4686 RepID=A0A5P1F158_ASPOF|nr:probable serine/threonine-protein kinase DDB_G0276461 [Asparagus officinalis]ONK70160.1 uncharacterized protein A4U43_C05F30890 [Asparagus officinalis]